MTFQPLEVQLICPTCKGEIEYALHTDEEVQNTGPKAGDFTICSSCGMPAVLHLSPLSETLLCLRALKPIEWAKCLQSEEFRGTLMAWSHAYLKHNLEAN